MSDIHEEIKEISKIETDEFSRDDFVGFLCCKNTKEVYCLEKSLYYKNMQEKGELKGKQIMYTELQFIANIIQNSLNPKKGVKFKDYEIDKNSLTASEGIIFKYDEIYKNRVWIKESI